MNIQTLPIDALLLSIVDEKIEQLSPEEVALLNQESAACSDFLLPILAQEVTAFLRDDPSLSPTRLCSSLMLLAHLGETRALEWTREICRVDPRRIEKDLGWWFATEDLQYILAAVTGSRWAELKGIVEDLSLDIYVRICCLSAIAFMVAKGQIERAEVVTYFKTLFEKLLSGEWCDEELAAFLVCTCLSLWPGEWEEEIRELFGIGLVKLEIVGVDELREHLVKGEAASIRRLQRQVAVHDFLAPLRASKSVSDPIDLEEEELLLDQEREVPKAEAKRGGRNDLCSCGSGLKRKKCCADKTSSFEKIRFEACTISNGPIEEPNVSREERELLGELRELVYDSPLMALKRLLPLLSESPNQPTYYNYLFIVYSLINRPHDAIHILKQTVTRFPRYLFGLVNYGLYLINRGEADKIPELFSNSYSLTQLYPERSVFHVSEWRSFAHLMGRYFCEIGEFEGAALYRDLLQRIDPDSEEAKRLQHTLARHLPRGRFKRSALA